MACAGPSSHCLYPKGCSRFSMLQTRLGLTRGSSRQGWRRLCCREGKKYRVEGGFKAGGEALRGVPVPISLPADCSVLEHCPIPPARRPPSSPRTRYVSRSVPPPQGSLSGWAPACRRSSQGLCFCRTEGSEMWNFCVSSAPNQCLLLVSLRGGGEKTKK